MQVKTIAVIGAGTLGRGIASAAALGGYRTILEDASSPAREQGMTWIQQSLDEGVACGKTTPQQRDIARAQLSTARSVEEVCREADLVIEAVPEEMEIKIEIFTILDKFAKPGAIFASTTSSLSITEMAAITFCPDKCVGMRFLDRVPESKLLEIVRAPETSGDTVETCREVGRRMGKEVVVVRESLGLIAAASSPAKKSAD
ncbi:MAG TPA: 3-hydroxyacyl-CoA dehydrogenase NAD-binding domain-containing protein [Candidatus Acidoferrales bacterium]|nr:3-hydroxyacyl-CoA dehydrogenase NAD-binding domain-containing protein [Candidatus Acidoferrales bacterium]